MKKTGEDHERILNYMSEHDTFEGSVETTERHGGACVCVTSPAGDRVPMTRNEAKELVDFVTGLLGVYDDNAKDRAE